MAQPIAMKSMSMLTFDQPRLVNLQRIETVVTPVFIQSQAGIIQGNPSAILQSTDNRSWCTLAGWLEPPQNAIVQCRKSGLTVRLKKRPEVSATLLPSAGNTPSAALQYKGKDGTPQQAPLRLVLDSNQGFVTLELPFPDTDLYDTVFTAMTGRDPAVAVRVSYEHPCQVKVPAPVTNNPPVTTKPITTRPVGGIGGAGTIQFKPGTIKMMQEAEPQTFAAAATASAFISKELLIGKSLDLRRAVVLPVPQPMPQGEIIQNQSFTGQLTVPLQHASDDLNVFPDRPWLQQSGWGQVPQNKKLLFRDSGKVDTFYYLPTKFKMGYYVAPEGGTLGMRQPLAVELYATDGGERIKATLVAVPCIEDSERQMLRAHLRDILKGLQPFIYLEPRAGLQASIANDFLSNSTAGQTSLPAEIRFEPVEVVADDRLVLRFDMPAERYPIFCSMLKFGISGRVLLAGEPGFQAQIELRLQLDDIVTNFVSVEQAPATNPDGTVAINATATLKVTNVIEHPLSISSLDLTLLDLGEKSGIIFEAEELKLLPSGGTLGGGATPNASTSFPVKAQRLVNWDSTVVERGQMKVQGGSADDWLNRVNRDPTLDKHKYQVMLHVLASAADRDRVQLIRVSLFKEGETTSRSRTTMVVGSNPTPFSVSMTLEELMGTSGKMPSFFIEYDTVDMTNNVSLPQRVPVSSETKDFHLLAIVESPGMNFLVEHDGATGRVREELDRPSAEQLINRLRSEGKSWDVFTKKAVSDPSGTPTSTTGTTPPPVTTPSFSVQIVTDLVAAKLQSGALKRIFVVLKPAQPGAAQTSFVFDPMNVAPATWKAELPPGTAIQFDITYLYASGQTRGSQGTMADMILILDAPNES